MFDIHIIITLLVSAAAVWIGGLIKKSSLSNAIIPWVTLAISLLNQIVQAVSGVTPASAGTAESAALVGIAVVHHSFLHQLLVGAGKGLVQALLTTGFVSHIKNGVLGAVSESTSYFRGI